MACPVLEYRSSDGTLEFDHTRPYCGLAGEFVSPMDADVCNDRFEFHHASHCERYRQYVASQGVEVVAGAPAVLVADADGGVDADADADAESDPAVTARNGRAD
jgi:hypothetical protein